MVVREAVGDHSAAAHDQSLFELDAKYADVVSLGETLEHLRSIGAAPARLQGVPGCMARMISSREGEEEHE